ncbi:DUF6266 family protein [Olivibacter domesticus]|uniref:Uncharacterized protein n=1 Tax=Olivibacter domesticus TaxID=407022 RepID=A0A1H7VEY3_OLID1|nr:DUF6266 family protein [Olivibacter domesticus]SEM07624.1 hypothetical protein SAMN05661044_04148 [Olivibacter domesticus]
MGRVINGANGAISGKVGSVVFCKWKNIDYVRGLPRINRNRKATEEQGKQRSKFGYMQDILGSIVPLVRLGFMNYAPNRTGHNSAMSHNIKHAITETEAGLRVIPENFMISGGILPAPREASISQEGNDFIFKWAYDAINVDRSHAGDRTLLLITDFKESPNYTKSGGFRDQGEDRLTMFREKYRSGTILHGYMAFFATDGSNNSSNSVYVGSIEVK